MKRDRRLPPVRGRQGQPVRAAAVPRPFVRNVLAAAEFTTLRTLRGLFARGGLPPPAERSAEDDARIAVFTALDGLVRVLDAFRNRVAHGEAVRLAVREQASAPGVLRVEVVIEPRAPS